MKYADDFETLTRAIRKAKTQHEVESLLFTIFRADLAGPLSARGRKLFAPSLDAFVPELAGRLGLRDAKVTKSNENVCIIATRFYATGGHTRIAGDIASLLGRPAVTVIFTNLMADIDREVKLDAGPYRAISRAELVLGAPTLLGRIVELNSLLWAIRPTRIILMPHISDIVAVTGAWPFRGIAEFIHHGDHVPSIGASLPWSAHVDPTYTCHQACKAAGLPAVYSGMAAPRVEAKPANRTPGKLRIATAGSPHKYQRPGRYKWTDYVVALLARPDVEFVHLGPDSDGLGQQIYAALDKNGIDRARYRMVGWVPSVNAALINENIDVYVSSYPESGGKSNLEAMAAHLPLITPQDPGMPELLRDSWPIDRAINIASPREALDGLARAEAMIPEFRTPERLAELLVELRRFDAYVQRV